MFKNLIILFLSIFLLLSCSKKENEIIVELVGEELAISSYTEGLEALKKGDAFYASKKFKEAENLFTQYNWASKASLMSGYAEYTRSSYTSAVFELERHIKNYPASKSISYAHYLIAICYYEQILDEKKDLAPLLKAKEKFEFIIEKYQDTDYGMDARFKINLIVDQLAAKEMSVVRYYMKTEKWIPALNRLKVVVKKYERTVFIEEALHRMVEIYYKLGLESEAKEAASILGYNYQSGKWYERSYKVFNKKYKLRKVKNKKEMGLIRKKLKSLFE